MERRTTPLATEIPLRYPARQRRHRTSPEDLQPSMRNMGAQQLARQIHEASISGPPSIAAYYLWQYRRRKLAPEARIIVSSRVKS